jgi:hypothetical protein
MLSLVKIAKSEMLAEVLMISAGKHEVLILIPAASCDSGIQSTDGCRTCGRKRDDPHRCGWRVDPLQGRAASTSRSAYSRASTTCEVCI